MARSIKNTFAPINRVPPDIFSLIPYYCKTDRELITLTHVCRDWREILLSRASLWTFLDCTDLDKTNAYIRRSNDAPLEICLEAHEDAHYSNDALLLTLPHIGRLEALTLVGFSGNLDILKLTEHFGSRAPILGKLDICIFDDTPVEITVFDGDLSPLRKLRLEGVLTNLPWRNLTNLTTFDFCRVSGDDISTIQLLDFFEHAPLLREIKLTNSLPNSSNAAERVVSLPHLRSLRIHAQPAHSILLNHLNIPIGASMALEFKFGGEKSPIPDYLPRSLDNLGNIHPITSISLSFKVGVTMLLKGPNGYLHMLGFRSDTLLAAPAFGQRALQSLNEFPISTTKTLTIGQYNYSTNPRAGESGACQTLLLMNNLRSLTLDDFINHPFIFALNPSRNTSNTVVCPKLEKLVLWIRGRWDDSCIDELVEMAEERASMCAKLSTILIVCPRELVTEEKERVSRFTRHVSQVEYRSDYKSPGWDTIPREVGGLRAWYI